MKLSNGEVYNHLKILEYVGKNKHGKNLYKCECTSCGNISVKIGTVIKNGYVKSCGCVGRSEASERMTKHGMTNSPLYKKWKSMKIRCYSNHYHAHHRYQGRNITVCDEWKNDFMCFYNDMKNGYFEGAELDRIDNNKGYSKENCRWVTHKTNSNNRGKYNNKTGYTGIHYRKNKNWYEANVCINRKPKHIGCYTTIEDAVNARKNFIISYNKENKTNLKYEEYKG